MLLKIKKLVVSLLKIKGIKVASHHHIVEKMTTSLINRNVVYFFKISSKNNYLLNNLYLKWCFKIANIFIDYRNNNAKHTNFFINFLISIYVTIEVSWFN